jgi:two-component system OmpR family response regulator
VATILVADDDAHIREVVRFALERAGHRVVEAADGSSALAEFARDSIDLVVLDIVMPGKDGLDVCRSIREKSDVAILFLSSRDDELDRILGLEMGADDYVTKPFSPRELVARVKAMLRRTAPARPAAPDEDAVVRHGPLMLDSQRHTCSWRDQAVFLTATEFMLLRSLLVRPERVYSRAELVERAYGHGHHITERTVDSHIRRIRKKFSHFSADPIETVFGVGYRMRAKDGQE